MTWFARTLLLARATILVALLSAALALGAFPSLAQQAASIAVDKTVVPLTLPEPGGAFTFTVLVTNTGSATVTIVALTDDVYGDLTTLAGSSCTNAFGTTLASGANYSCSFTGDFAGNAGASQTDNATATALDGEDVATGSDGATVTLSDVVPAITVAKSVSPPSLPAPGGTFTFSVLVTNTGGEAVTITSLLDDIHGDLGAAQPGSTCNTAIGTVLASGGTYSCAFTAQFSGSVGASQTDTVTATAEDDEGNEATAFDQASVALTAAITVDNIPALDGRALVLLAVLLAALGIVAIRSLH